MERDAVRDRGHWSSRLGFVMAAAGSAIGLGNLWKFPYITWHNEGGAFVLVYLLCIAAVGMPIMLAELLIGRKTQKSPVGALRETFGRHWGWLGALGVMTGFVILSYYSVIAGWSLRYFAVCFGWSVDGYDVADAGGTAFGAFVGDGSTQVLLTLAFMLITTFVVWRGIAGGIERVTRLLMPTLVAILVLLLVSALTMEGAGEALSMIFVPHFGELEAVGVLEALGHSFFTLSLGMGAMITYGSYLSKKESVVSSGATVVVLDTVIALMATVIMFSVIFSVPEIREGLSGSAVGMLFITLPQLFYTVVPFGVVLAPLFYLLVAFAALTSTISLLEVVVSYFIDEHRLSRGASSLLSGVAVSVVAVLCALSLGAHGGLSGMLWIARDVPGKAGLLSQLDHLASNWLLPLGGFFITFGAGWLMTREETRAELVEATTPSWFRYDVWRVFIRYVAPLAVGAILVAVIAFGKDFS